MKTDSPVVIQRSAYQPTDYLIESINLDFQLDATRTVVTSTLSVYRNPESKKLAGSDAELVLNGEGLELVDLTLNGTSLTANDYQLDTDLLRIGSSLDTFELQTVVRINPEQNTSLSGLYLSNGNFFTQCEAEGFRRITWFPDRPDVMCRFTVKISADKVRYPVLLSNGNLTKNADDNDKPGWHWASWEDPFPKPSYLFALVAGNLVNVEETVKTASGDERLLQVWVEPGNTDKTDHAMQSLIRALRWDEQRYGLELDLDRFMIVAVSDFNMGAMENKGLNIFNTKYVFANPKIATDTDFANVESVVGHEYFHNWTGNRVTCRDWFQLTLKEGLTVFRDQEFSADVMADQAESELGKASARVVKRIGDVRLLRMHQFAEDAGPMAHPIRPDSYSEINNFYTVTIYEKGAEVIRMIQTLVGVDGFRRGMDLYFERHDGQAVTCDDFVDAMATANNRDFSQFSHWYSQAGTPLVSVNANYDASNEQYTLRIKQSCAPTPGQPRKQPFLIPFTLALLNSNGKHEKLVLADKSLSGDQPELVLELTETEQTFVFENIASEPIPSLLRGFCAPVVLDYQYQESDLVFLARHETDPFNRWEAIQRLAIGVTIAVLNGADVATQSNALVDTVAAILSSTDLDPAYQALVLSFPGEGYIAEQMSQVNPVAVRDARNSILEHLSISLAPSFEQTFKRFNVTQPFQSDPVQAGQRAMKNLALGHLVTARLGEYEQIASDQAANADNMTDRFAALSALVNSGAKQREPALAQFASTYVNEALVMDKWFSLQAVMHRQAEDPPVIERVRALTGHPDFSLTNPNRVRSLVGSFCAGNLAEFHAADGSGYQFWLEQVLKIDKVNPQVAARISRAMDRWSKYDSGRQQKMLSTLKELAQTESLSRDVAEIVGKALSDN